MIKNQQSVILYSKNLTSNINNGVTYKNPKLIISKSFELYAFLFGTQIVSVSFPRWLVMVLTKINFGAEYSADVNQTATMTS